jgi:uncharacterized protein (DUF983 family)
MNDRPGPDSGSPDPVRRTFGAMMRGFRRRCPRCGKGRLFNGYLSPLECCGDCGAETGRIYTADIAPYFTILIVGHIIVPLVLMSEKLAAPPMPLQIVFWPLAALALACWFLPRVKGCIMGLMWALGMQGHEHQ